MKQKFLILSTGFALFSMFFGSGNLVFPLLVGKNSGGHIALAALGLLLTGVIVPFLGVFAMRLFKGDAKSFFGTMGQPATFWFPLIALSLMGPFGVLARCITVAHGSFQILFPHTSLIVFSAISCCIIYFVTMHRQRIIPLLGTYLTPFLLCSLLGIIILGWWFGEFSAISSTSPWKAFQDGFFQGYQTMDLLAAFFFSVFVIQHLESRLKDQEQAQTRGLNIFVKSAFVGASLLACVYIALVYLGAAYSSQLEQVPPEEMLGTIASYSMGPLATPIVCLAVVLACFTTAVVLASLFADFLKQEVIPKASNHLTLSLTLLIAFSISTLEFAGIARFLAPILEALYPALIVLTILNMASHVIGFKSHRWPIVATLLAKLYYF